ncbi:MAG: NAD(+)/NADH kinase [Parasporobacterium sp.]|nr:NAD(+)/NADH kinase [Parasporobacterium sp.]
MKKFFIITNPKKDPEFSVTRKVSEYLIEKGCRSNTSLFDDTSEKDNNLAYTDYSLVPKDTEAIIVIGGDGTLIHAAKDLISLNIPLIGINFGTLGYLAEIESDSPDSVKKALDALIDDNYSIENRMLLEANVIRNGEVVYKDIALNDVVINRTGTLNVMDFNVCVDNEFLNCYHADGVIISTPTGSTGYNLSAGGPVAMPTAEIIMVTPVCAHTLNSRSIVFSADITIEIEVLKNAKDLRIKKIVACDADNECQLMPGDKVVITKAGETVRVIKLHKTSFIELMGKKMR